MIKKQWDCVIDSKKHSIYRPEKHNINKRKKCVSKMIRACVRINKQTRAGQGVELGGEEWDNVSRWDRTLEWREKEFLSRRKECQVDWLVKKSVNEKETLSGDATFLLLPPQTKINLRLCQSTRGKRVRRQTRTENQKDGIRRNRTRIMEDNNKVSKRTKRKIRKL